MEGKGKIIVVRGLHMDQLEIMIIEVCPLYCNLGEITPIRNVPGQFGARVRTTM